MELDEREASFHTYMDREKTFYFCSERCKRVFDQGPEAEELEKLNWWQRFLRRLGNAGHKRYGGKPPSCH